jgi:molecular chaperone Hsp33
MDRTTAGFDQLTRFWLETAPARGVVARLDESLSTALRQHAYAPAVASCLRQLAGAAVLLASNLKQKAHVVLQAQGTGAVPLLCVEASDGLTFRAYANVREDAQLADDADLVSLVAPNGDGRFVLSIVPVDGQPYQGIVGLHGGSVATLLEEYLTNSQQTQTRLWLRQDGEAIEAMMLERLPEKASDEANAAWDAVVAQAETMFAEPFMPFPYVQWLQFAFPGHDVKVHPAQALAFACACSFERVLNALKLVGEAELMPLLEEKNVIETRCEFCGAQYVVSESQLLALFRDVSHHRAPGTDTLQ